MSGAAQLVFALLTASCGGIPAPGDATAPFGAPVSFENEVVPILTRLGCSAGACHGKARGQNGFALSLFGFYPELDYVALTQEARGRRVSPSAPEASLLLLKGSGQIPHGGGKRFAVGDAYYETLRRWIAEGTPRALDNEPRIARLAISPVEKSLKFGDRQPLSVTAYFSDGSTREVTNLAAFQSSEPAIVSVDETGVAAAGTTPGEATIMARFLGKIVTCNLLIPLPERVPAAFYASLPRQTFVDEHIWNKLERLAITPSEPAPEHTWLRRAYLDIIGRLPTPDEVRAFLADQSSDKRARLVDQLLERPEYAEHWANKWADLLRANPFRVGIKAALNFDAWIREAFRQNKPYDQFVGELVLAQGSTWHNGAVTLLRDRREPDEIGTIVSRLFLGIRLDCAKCHHHPFERWSQEDFYGFAAYFAQLDRKGKGNSPPISASEEIVFTAEKAETVVHPLTGEPVPPKALFGDAPVDGDADADPRKALSAWLTSPDNPYFAQVIANRVWAEMMGVGIVEPVDDLRVTNPPTNPALLAALADELRRCDFNLKDLIRKIANSYVYGLSSLPGERNAADTRNYSRHYRRRPRSETLLDAVCDITQVPEAFSGVPAGTRAVSLWTHRADSPFLDAFGRPDPSLDPPCERTSDVSVGQALHMMNAPALNNKITSNNGRAAHLAAADKSPREVVEELYLLVYSRYPADAERQTCEALFDAPDASRRQVIEDLLWALLNTPEFVFED